MKKNILLAGYYGANNLGDDAILVSIIKLLKNEAPNLSFEVLSFNPQKTTKDFGVKAINWRNIPALTEAILRANLVIIGGGGLFMDYWGLDENSYFRSVHGGISTYGTPAWLADALGIPWMLFGVGVGPLYSKTAQEHTLRLFSKAPLATLRDENSLFLLQSVGINPIPEHIHLTADPAFGLEVSPVDRQKAHELCVQLGLDTSVPLIGVSIRYWEQAQQPEEWVTQLSDGLREFMLRTNTQVLLLPFQIEEDRDLTDDLKVCRSLFRELDLSSRVFLLEERLSPFEMQALLGSCDLILGMRLHALLMAVNEGVPVVALAYDPKITTFMRRGNLEQWVCSMPFEKQSIFDLLDRAWKERDSLVMHTRAYKQRMLPLMEENVALALNLLDSYIRQPSDQKLISFLIERLSQMQYMDDQIRILGEHIQDLNGNIQGLNDKIRLLKNELNEAMSQAILAQQHLTRIESSQTYKIALRFQGIRNFFLPPGSRLEGWLFKLLRRSGGN